MAAANGYAPRRGVTLKRVSRAPIPFHMENPDDPNDVIDFEVKSSAVFSPRDHKLVMNYVQAALEFQTFVDSEISDQDYAEMERMMEEAVSIATNLPLNKFRQLDFDDRLSIVALLSAAYNEANSNRMDAVDQIRNRRQAESESEEGGGFFKKMTGRRSNSSRPQPISAVPTADESATG